MPVAFAPVNIIRKGDTGVICYYSVWSLQCCRRHVVGQQVVSDVSVVRSCRRIYSLSSESNNTNLSLHLLIAVIGTSMLRSHTKHTLPCNVAACTW